MSRIMICGIGTGVGKTIVSSILVSLFQADYWKPIQCGKDRDAHRVKSLITPKKYCIHPSTYTFDAPVSPHHAAALEGRSINLKAFQVPQTSRPLIIEGVGGALVPLTTSQLTIDLMRSWNATWIIVSKHYLGSINHTLLTIEALKQRKITIAGLIINGEPQKESEQAIVNISQLPLLARLYPESHFDFQTINRYAIQWKPLLSGTLLRK